MRSVIKEFDAEPFDLTTLHAPQSVVSLQRVLNWADMIGSY